MSILIDETTRVLIQGITGSEGSKACANMLAYGTKVVAGVTPGKGGQEVGGVPVYDSIREALEHHKIDASVICVPGTFAKGAMMEAIENSIPLINVLTEHIPIHDTAVCLAHAKQANLRIVGPSSVGIISPGKSKLGSIGGSEPERVFTQGSIGVISKSGGMASEISLILKRAGLGQSTVIGIGGDMLIGSIYHELLELFEKDPKTKGVVIYGELGGTYEEQLAEFVKARKFTKPIAAFIGGDFASSLPEGIALGHAGALIEGNVGHPQAKREALEEAGVMIARVPGELAELMKDALAQDTV